MSKTKYKQDKFTTEVNPVNYSFSHLREFHGAILFGAYKAKFPLPEVYTLEMQSYLDSIKKNTKGKNRGKSEDTDEDLVGFVKYIMV